MISEVKKRFREIITLDESPERIALAFSIGVFIAFSPTIGLHTLSVLFVSYFWKLNIGVLFLGAFVNNPWTMVPIYSGCLWFGMQITGGNLPVDLDWRTITFSNFMDVISPVLFSFVTGTLIIGIIASVVSYYIMKNIICRIRGCEPGSE